MKKETKKGLKLLKTIRPEKDWKSDLRMEIFGPPQPLAFRPVSFEFGFASLVGVAALAVIVFTGLFNNAEPVEYNQLNPELKQVAMEVKEGEIAKQNQDFINYLLYDAEIEKMDSNEKTDLAKRSTEVLIQELSNVEDRIATMLTMME